MTDVSGANFHRTSGVHLRMYVLWTAATIIGVKYFARVLFRCQYFTLFHSRTWRNDVRVARMADVSGANFNRISGVQLRTYVLWTAATTIGVKYFDRVLFRWG